MNFDKYLKQGHPSNKTVLIIFYTFTVTFNSKLTSKKKK